MKTYKNYNIFLKKRNIFLKKHYHFGFAPKIGCDSENQQKKQCFFKNTLLDLPRGLTDTPLPYFYFKTPFSNLKHPSFVYFFQQIWIFLPNFGQRSSQSWVKIYNNYGCLWGCFVYYGTLFNLLYQGWLKVRVGFRENLL